MKANAVFPLLVSLAFLPCTSQAADEQAPAPQRLQDLRGAVEAHFNHDASRVLVGTRGSAASLWAVEEGTPATGEIDAQALSGGWIVSADGKTLVVLADDSVRVFELATGRALSPRLSVKRRESTPTAVLAPLDGRRGRRRAPKRWGRRSLNLNERSSKFRDHGRSRWRGSRHP